MASFDLSQSIDQILSGVTSSFSSAPNSSSGGQSQPAASASANKKKKESTLLPEYTVIIACNDLGIHINAPLPPDFDWGINAAYDTPIKDIIGQGVSTLGMIGQAASTGIRASGLSMVTQALTAKFWAGSSSGAITLPLVFQAETDEVEDVLKPLAGLLSLTMPRQAGGKGSLLQAPGPHFDIAAAFNKVASDINSATTNTSTVAGKSTTTSTTGGFGAVLGTLTKPITNVANQLLTSDYSSALSSVSTGISTAAGYADDVLKQGVKNQISIRLGNYMFFNSVVITNVDQKHFVQPVGSTYGKSTGNMQRIEVGVTFEPFFDQTQQDLLTIFLDSRLQSYVNTLLTTAGVGTGSSNSTQTTVVHSN